MLSKMNNPAFLVEGDLEQKFVQNVCPKSPVRRINCNGKTVVISEIAKRVGTLGRLLHKRHSPLVVIFDREKRSESCEEIERIFRTSLEQEDIDVPVLVGIPDRDIENWILADFETFVNVTNIEKPTAEIRFEGKKGKSEIRKLLPPKKTYVETTDGVAWLRKCRPTKMICSASFDRFAKAMKEIPCWWLSENKFELKSEDS
jgi:hypothetical protein